MDGRIKPNPFPSPSGPCPSPRNSCPSSPILNHWSNDLSILHAEFNPTIYFIELLSDQTGHKQGTLSLLTWYTSLAAKASERVRNVGKDAFAWYWLPSASVVIVEPLIHHFTVKRPFDQRWQGRLYYEMKSHLVWIRNIRTHLPHLTNWITTSVRYHLNVNRPGKTIGWLVALALTRPLQGFSAPHWAGLAPNSELPKETPLNWLETLKLDWDTTRVT